MAPIRNSKVSQQACLEKVLEVRPRVYNLFCRRANIKHPENFAGQSEIVIHVISTHKLNFKDSLLTVFTQKRNGDFFRILNNFRVTYTPNFPSLIFKYLFN